MDITLQGMVRAFVSKVSSPYFSSVNVIYVPTADDPMSPNKRTK